MILSDQYEHFCRLKQAISAKMISWLIHRKVIANKVICQTKMQNILWFQLLKCEDLLLFFVLYESKVDIWGFLDGWLDKMSNLKMPSLVFFPVFWHFMDKTIKQQWLINLNVIMCQLTAQRLGQDQVISLFLQNISPILSPNLKTSLWFPVTWEVFVIISKTLYFTFLTLNSSSSSSSWTNVDKVTPCPDVSDFVQQSVKAENVSRQPLQNQRAPTFNSKWEKSVTENKYFIHCRGQSSDTAVWDSILLGNVERY